MTIIELVLSHKCDRYKHKIMKKQAPIVFWDFEIDEEEKIAFKKEEGG